MTAQEIKEKIKGLQLNLEMLILQTPTSARRNILTDANIHLLAAIEALEKA